MNPRRQPGAAIAVVTNLNDPEQTGRIKVRFPWMNDEEESHWCRIVADQAGKSRGNFVRPEVGDEVLVLFERGDPNQPMVVGCLWNGQDAPPGPGNGDGANDHKFFQSRAGHQMLFNDGGDGGFIAFHDGTQKLHTTFDVPGKHIHWLADSGTITLQAPEGKVRFGCVDFKVHSTQNTTVNVSKQTTLKVTGKRSYQAKTLTQTAGSSLSISTPNLSVSCKVYSQSSGSTSVSIGSVKAQIEPTLEMEMAGPVTRTIAGKSTIQAKAFRTENDGPSGPLTLVGAQLKVQADGAFAIQAGAPVTIQAGQVMQKASTIVFGKDMEQGKGLGRASLIQLLAGQVALNPGMFTFQTTKHLDVIMGMDFHNALPTPPAIPAPFPMMPHGFINPILIDVKNTVLVNGTPVAGAGATAVGCHMPPSLPAPWTPMPITFRGLITAAIVAGFLPAIIAAGSMVAGILGSLVSGANPKSVLLAGADDAGTAAERWFMRAFPMFQSYGAFLGMLAGLLPYPIANGSITIGVPNVLAEDTPMSMGTMPFCNSCSDLPIVPNGMVIASSNVMVGIDLMAIVEQLAWAAAFGAAGMAVGKGISRRQNNQPNRVQPGSPDNLSNSRATVPDATPTPNRRPGPAPDAPARPPNADGPGNAPARPQADNPALGHPVDPVSGTLFDKHVDLELPGPLPLRVERNYNSKVGGVGWGGVLGVGWRLNFESYLTLHWKPESVGAGAAPPRRSKRVEPTAATHFWALHDAEMRVARFPFLDALGDFHYLGTDRLELCRADAATWDIRDRDGVTWRYQQHAPDAARLEAWFDAHGNTVSVHYPDETGTVPDALVDSAGRRVQLVYGEGGRLEAIEVETPSLSPGGGDAGGERWTERRLRSYVYDAEGRLVETRDAVGEARRYAYDALGRLVREVEPGGYTWYFHYDPQGRCTVTYGEDLHAWCAFDYQPATKMTVVSDHTGTHEIYQYDELGRVVTLLHREGGATHTGFDEAGNVAEITDANGETTEMAWDDHGRLLEQTLPDGGKHRWVYDQRGWLVAEIDPAGGETRHTYDKHGNRARTKHADGGETLRRFDERGLCVAEVRPDGSEHTYAYDEAGNRVEERSEDALGTLVQRHTYDGLGRLLRTETETSEGLSATTWRYDAAGRPLERSDPDGHTVRWTYTPRGKVAEETDRAGQVWITRTDGMDRQVERRTPEGRVVHTTRGDDALYAAHQDAAGRGYRYAYDKDGRLRRHATDDGVVERYDRDGAGHLVGARFAGGERVRYTNDANGRPIEVESSDGVRQTFVRDPMGRFVESIEFPPWSAGRRVDDLPEGGEVRVALRRAPDGRVTEELGPQGRVRRRFGPGGAQLGLQVRLSLEGEGEVIGLSVRRDRFGQPKVIEAPDGVWRFAQGAWIAPEGATFVEAADAAPAERWALRDAEGRPAAAYEADVDVHGRRTGEHLTLAGGAAKGWQHRFDFDRDGRLAESYDAGGNRKLPGHRYGAGQRLLRDAMGAVEYDARGRIIARQTEDGEQRLWWDPLGRLREVEMPDGTVVRYRYDALNRMVERWEDPVRGLPRRWSFLWDGDGLAGEVRPDGTRVAYLRLNPDDATPWAAWVESPWGNGLYRLLTDARGAVIAAADGRGALAWLGRYDAYGDCETRDRGFDQRLRLPGMWADPLTGLCLNRFRWYAPTWGRYLTPDPLGVSGGFNPYTYADGDPVHRTDPLGLTTHDHQGDPPRTDPGEPPRQPGTALPDDGSPVSDPPPLRDRAVARADAERPRPAAERPRVAAAMETPDGTQSDNVSWRGPREDAPDLPPKTQQAFDDIPDDVRTEQAGKCAEPQLIADYERQHGELPPEGTKFHAVDVRGENSGAHGRDKPACQNCSDVMRRHGWISESGTTPPPPGSGGGSGSGGDGGTS